MCRSGCAMTKSLLDYCLEEDRSDLLAQWDEKKNMPKSNNQNKVGSNINNPKTASKVSKSNKEPKEFSTQSDKQFVSSMEKLNQQEKNFQGNQDRNWFYDDDVFGSHAQDYIDWNEIESFGYETDVKY